MSRFAFSGLLAACAATPATFTTPPAPPPPAPSPPPPIESPSTARARDEGPDPPMALRWSFHEPSVGGRPSMTERLTVLESGDVAWESVREGGDGDVDEELGATRTPPTDATRCRGHVRPAQHREIVSAAQRAITSGCAKVAAADRLGRPAEAGATTLQITWAGTVTSCDVARSGGTYATFERLRTELVASICAGR